VNPEYPSVSIIVLNFNGLVFLEPCFASLEHLDYPRSRLEVILVDNGSTDGSVPFVRERFPRVTIIENGVNLGFAGGNNVGIRASRGDYVALLNNDTHVEKDWLIELVKVAEQDPAVSACTSKILLLDNRLRIQLKTDPFRPSDVGLPHDPRELGVLVEEAVVRGESCEREVEFLEGFYPEDRFGQKTARWTMDEAALGIPVKPDDRSLTLRLRLSNPRPHGVAATAVSILVADRVLASLQTEFGPRCYDVALGRSVLDLARPVVQNAGSMILPDGSGRDRGALVVNSQQLFLEDNGQYDRVEEVFAACGAGALFRRAMLDDVGLFDDYFFMYYEDTDLAWRARLKGWKIMYAPRAVMRHVHCGTSVEWSPSFMFHTYRNRLAMLLKNAPIRMVLRECAKYSVSASMLGLKVVAQWALGAEASRLASDLALRVRAFRSLVGALPALWRKRRTIQGTRRVDHVEVIRWMQPSG
jgi:GT2 family glycosyltransferase